jgi:hypothetical protein
MLLKAIRALKSRLKPESLEVRKGGLPPLKLLQRKTRPQLSFIRLSILPFDETIHGHDRMVESNHEFRRENEAH